MQIAAHGTILQHDSTMPLVKTVQPSRSAGLASTLSTLTQEHNINNHVPSVIILLDRQPPRYVILEAFCVFLFLVCFCFLLLFYSAQSLQWPEIYLFLFYSAQSLQSTDIDWITIAPPIRKTAL